MGKPALDAKNDPLAIEGMEEIFDTFEPEIECSEASEESAVRDSEVFGTAREILTTTEAATRLGISPRAVINRLKAGTLPGERIKGKFKEEWRVYWETLPNTSEETIINPDEASEASEAGAEKQTQHFRSSSEATNGSNLLSEILSAHTEQIKTQNDLIRYLTEQLKEKDQRIKLLSDSQHKQGWWHRFGAWFIGSNKNDK